MVDASNLEAEQQIQTCYQVLEEIGVNCSNVLLVLNKVDEVPDPSFVAVLRRHYEDTVTISAATGEGIERLSRIVAERLSGGFVTAEIETGSGNGRLLAWLTQHAEELDRTYTDETARRVRITCRLPHRFVTTINDPDATVMIVDGDAAVVP